MSIWAAQGFAAVDFAARTTTMVRPSRELFERRFDISALDAAQVEHYKQHLLDEHLPQEQQQFEAVDALALELQDFVTAIRESRAPRVTGEDGRRAVAVAEQILTKIDRHAWNGVGLGPVGPLALPRRGLTSAVPLPLAG
jgi:predicted dehydrogenase